MKEMQMIYICPTDALMAIPVKDLILESTVEQKLFGVRIL
jgi:hypothetical protein